MLLECPNCREPVSFLRSVRTTAWNSFRCKVCGSVLGISFGRRMFAGGLWLALLLFAMKVLQLDTLGRFWTYTAMGVAFVVILYVCEKVVLLDRRAFTCKGCGYDLHGLTENRCPECGVEFDPAERDRILARVASPAPKPRYRWIVVLVIVLLTISVVAGLLAWRKAATPTPAPAPGGSGSSASTTDNS